MDSTSEKNHSPIQNNKTPHALTQLSILQAELIAIQFNILSGESVWVLPIFRRFKG
jgi:hypothetical protein